MAVTLQAELTTEERAIRHLIGEQKALTSELARAEAKAKLLQARIHAQKVQKPEAPAIPGVPSGLRFADVSSYQPRVSLPDVRHAFELIQLVHVDAAPLMVVKATEGLDYVDGYLAARWPGMAGAGFAHRGAYHFLHPGDDGEAQALHMLEAITAGGREIHPTDILVCDAEVTDGCTPAQVANCVATFGSTLQKHAPAKRWLYTGGPFAEENGLALKPLYDAHWLPAYVADPSPYYVKGWGKPIAWQFSDGVHGPTPHLVTGIGACDVSIVL